VPSRPLASTLASTPTSGARCSPALPPIAAAPARPLNHRRFDEEVALQARMRGLAEVVERCEHPDFVCLQVRGGPACMRACLHAAALPAARQRHLNCAPRPAPPASRRRHPTPRPPRAAATRRPARLAPPPHPQEVTHNILDIWRKAEWYKKYRGSPVPMEQPYFTHLLVKKEGAAAGDQPSFSEQRFSHSRMGGWLPGRGRGWGC
jgi:hypothetical protein